LDCRQAASRWHFSRKIDWIVQVFSAARDKGHTGALYSKNRDRAAEVEVPLFTTALGLYGDVLWSGELQGFILHEVTPALILDNFAHTSPPPNGPGQRPKTARCVQYELNAAKQLRGPKHKNWPVCDPRAAPPGGYGLKSGENGHLARANGAIDGPYSILLISLAQCVLKAL
jgi:hypothetical protein